MQITFKSICYDFFSKHSVSIIISLVYHKDNESWGKTKTVTQWKRSRCSAPNRLSAAFYMTFRRDTRVHKLKYETIFGFNYSTIYQRPVSYDDVDFGACLNQTRSSITIPSVESEGETSFMTLYRLNAAYNYPHFTQDEFTLHCKNRKTLWRRIMINIPDIAFHITEVALEILL